MSSDAMGIWLVSNNGADVLPLPVLPEEHTEPISADNSTVDIVNLSKVTVIGLREPAKYSLESIFPAHWGPDVLVSEAQLLSPYQYVDKIRALIDARAPVRYIMTGRVNVLCTIESLDITEHGGDPGTLEYTLKLLEYRAPVVRSITVGADGTGTVPDTPAREDTASVPRTYTVLDGDCLYKIARKVLGDGARWREIYELNKNIVRKNYIIWAGMVLTMPER